MAVTGKTGADAYYKTVKKQAQIIAKYGPKLTNTITGMEALSLITPTEAAAIVACINAVPSVLSVIKKVADYAGLW